MNYKIIATDFDGTLVNSKGFLTEKTKNKLLELRTKGYIIVGVTGRILSSVVNRIDKSLFDYLILCDGTFIYDTHKEETIYASFLPEDLIKDIIQTFASRITKIDLASLHNYYLYKDTPYTKSEYVKEVKDISLIPEQISRMTLFFKNNEEVEHYHKIIKNKYKIVNAFIMQDSFSDLRRININMRGVNKVSTLKLLGNKLNISLEEIIFFGDGLNDLEIFESPVFSVAMGNALEEIKKKSNDITLTNDEDGVAYYLDKITDK